MYQHTKIFIRGMFLLISPAYFPHVVPAETEYIPVPFIHFSGNLTFWR